MEQRLRDMPEDYQYLTPVNIAITVINIVVFIVLSLLGDTTSAIFMFHHGAMYPAAVIQDGEWYRIITSAFIHFGPSHLVNNMIMLVALGSYMERAIGKLKYLIFYLICAAGSSLVSLWVMIYTGDIAVSGGASGAIFGIIGGLLFLVLRNKGRFGNLSMTRFLIMLFLSLYYGFVTAGVDNAAHVGGLAIGFICGILFYRKNKTV